MHKRFEEKTISHFTRTRTPPKNARPIIFLHDKQTQQNTASQQCGSQVGHDQTSAIFIDSDEAV